MVTGGMGVPGPHHTILPDRPKSPASHSPGTDQSSLQGAPEVCVRMCVRGGTMLPLPLTLNSAAKGLLALSREVVSRRF